MGCCGLKTFYRIKNANKQIVGGNDCQKFSKFDFICTYFVLLWSMRFKYLKSNWKRKFREGVFGWMGWCASGCEDDQRIEWWYHTGVNSISFRHWRNMKMRICNEVSVMLDVGNHPNVSIFFHISQSEIWGCYILWVVYGRREAVHGFGVFWWGRGIIADYKDTGIFFISS